MPQLPLHTWPIESLRFERGPGPVRPTHALTLAKAADALLHGEGCFRRSSSGRAAPQLKKHASTLSIQDNLQLVFRLLRQQLFHHFHMPTLSSQRQPGLSARNANVPTSENKNIIYMCIYIYNTYVCNTYVYIYICIIFLSINQRTASALLRLATRVERAPKLRTKRRLAAGAGGLVNAGPSLTVLSAFAGPLSKRALTVCQPPYFFGSLQVEA